jgi:hypothetical protein
MDKRRKYFLVVDVETANSTEQALTYDLGFSVCDKQGRVYESRSYAISDIFFDEKKIFNNRELMDSAYYKEKLPQYFDGIRSGAWKVSPLLTVRKEIHQLMEEYNINVVCAYNCHFDKNALNTTLRYVTKSSLRWFFPYGTEFYCIWNMACQTICKQKGFLRFCFENGLYSKSGNCKTNAETVWAYMTQNPSFEEKHTGLEDVKIEVQIMARCFRQHKKMDKGINRLCWRVPQADFKALLE